MTFLASGVGHAPTVSRWHRTSSERSTRVVADRSRASSAPRSWALPAQARRQTQPQSRPRSPGPTQPRQGLVQQETLAKVKQLCETVGFGLSKFTLQKYGGVADASKIGFAKLTTVFEKLADLANGIERLRTASAKLPDGRYTAICRELNFASDSLDDIPDR